jgi:hypothetical protein
VIAIEHTYEHHPAAEILRRRAPSEPAARRRFSPVIA